MKKLIIGSAFLFLGMNAFAQSTSKDFLAKVTELENATAATNYGQIAEDFAEISASDNKNWLAHYYTALSYLKLGTAEALSGKIPESQKSANSATAFINKASELAKDNDSQSEIFLLKYMQKLILAAGNNYNMDEMNRNFENIRKASELNPNNPRIALVAGESTYFLPENLGGSKEKGRQILSETLSKFDSYTAKPNQPNWGKAEILKILKEK